MPITSKPAVYYGHQFTTRKIINAFMDFLGQNLFVERYDENGLPFRYIQVPVQYARREYQVDMIKATNQKHATGDTTNLIDINRLLPRLGVNITTITYDGERRMQKKKRQRGSVFDGSQSSLITVPAPAPYNIEIEVSILAKSMDDTLQIMEQVFPYFSPTLSLNLDLVPGFETESIPFSLVSVVPETNDELSINESRVLISILAFNCKANYYFFKRDVGIIKQIIANLHMGQGSGVDETFQKFKQYQLDADNPIPTTTLAERGTEPVTTTIDENPPTSITITIESGHSGTISLTNSDNDAQFTAIATLADETTLDVTTLATWDSETVATATINSVGLATAIAAGTTKIRALYKGEFSNAFTLTVTA